MRDIDADRALVDDVTGTTFGQRVRGIEAAEVKAHEKEEMGIILRARGELEHLIDSRSPNQIKEGLDAIKPPSNVTISQIAEKVLVVLHSIRYALTLVTIDEQNIERRYSGFIMKAKIRASEGATLLDYLRAYSRRMSKELNKYIKRWEYIRDNNVLPRSIFSRFNTTSVVGKIDTILHEDKRTNKLALELLSIMHEYGRRYVAGMKPA